MSVAAIIVAAGRGTRAGGAEPKQWRDLGGRSVLARSVAAFTALPGARVILVLHPEDMARGVAEFGGAVTLVAGAAERAGSVRNALETLEGSEVTRVLIHDGARPFPAPALIARVLAALETAPAAAPALPVTDALWRGDGGRVAGTQDRAGLFRAQTPQGFRFPEILAAHRAHPGGAMDDVEVALAAGMAVDIVAGAEDNIKITFPEDFARGLGLLRERAMQIRLGNGYDVHAFTEGTQVTLCGVAIPHGRGLLGHSDADVAMHAATDAIYGALAEGDIGRHFPPSDPQWKGAASEIFLRHAMDRARARGFALGNLDLTIVCERPKIGPHAPAMIARMAEILAAPQDRISVKATTSERLGFTGREEGIAALATVCLTGD